MKRLRPTFDTAVGETRDLLIQIYKAVEAGILSARDFFDNKTEGERPFDRTVFATLVRYKAKQVLDSAGTHAEVDIEIDRLSNIGLQVRHDLCIVRIRLDPDLQVPLPGQSHALQDYYRNPSVIHLFKREEVDQVVEEIEGPYKLVFIWRAPAPTFQLEASLAYPKAADPDGKSVTIWWNEPLPLASILARAPQPATASDLPTRSTQPDAMETGG